MGRKQIAGLLGSALLFFGVFAPAVTGLFGMTQSFFQLWRIGGSLIFLLSVVSAYLTLKKSYSILAVTGVTALALIGLSYFLASSQPSGPFGLGGVQMAWGWTLLFSGAALLVAAAVIKNDVNT